MSVLLLWGAMAGCAKENSKPPATGAEPDKEGVLKRSELLYVAGSEGMEVETRDLLRHSRGWVLLPPPGGKQVPSRGGGGGRDRDQLLALLESCRDCHPDYYDGFQQTAHARTSSPARLDAFLELPPDGGLTIATELPGFKFRVERQSDVIKETVHVETDDGPFEHGEPIDVIFGSGKYGQTYLYWFRDRLYQLPISYLAYRHTWAMSPGYADGTADFARPITTRCLDCHTTSATHLPDTINGFVRDSIVYGLHCIRCHGEASDHVAFHREHPDATSPEHLTLLATLTAGQLNDLCAQCHSGGFPLRKPAYSYRPGDSLEEYLELEDEETSKKNDNDPHSANQLQRLSQSACFKNSSGMSCATCHNLHRHERNDQLVFAKRCLSCHEDNPKSCPERRSLTETNWLNNCVACHMPQRKDPRMASAVSGETSTPKLREHFISIWPDVAEEIKAKVNSGADGGRAP